MSSRRCPDTLVWWKAKYESWWLNKRCRITGDILNGYRLVTKITLTGPPSFVYGGATLHFDDGSHQNVVSGSAYRPRRCDVEVEP
jgi:hypothetical protein